MMQKFRIWDKVDNCWLGDLVHRPYLSANGDKLLLVKTVQPFDERGQYLAVGPKIYEVTEVILDDDRYDVMYHCGLRYGNHDYDIFDKDILLDPHIAELGVVSWDAEDARWTVTTTSTTEALSDWGTDITVLGNVYDNPELVEGGI